MDKSLHNQIYGGIPRGSLGGTRIRQSSASSYSTTGRKSNHGGVGASPLGGSSFKKGVGQR